MSDPRITDEAVEAALDVVMDDGHNGLDCRPDRNLAVTMRAAVEAALPHLAPQPVLDRETLLIEMNEAAERNDFGKFLEDDDFEALTRAVEKVARPMPTREQFAEATHDFDHAHSWRDERFCPQYACLEVYLPRADAVLALLNGTAK